MLPIKNPQDTETELFQTQPCHRLLYNSEQALESFQASIS